MKKTIKYFLIFSLFFCLKSVAQHHPSLQEVTSDKTTHIGKRQLRKENKTHRASEKLARRNEHSASKNHKTGTMSTHKSMTKKLKKERRKAKKEELKKQQLEEKNKNKTVPEEEKIKGG